MPYIGVTIPDGNNKIRIKLHGTFDNFPVSPVELRECANTIWNELDGINIPLKVIELADKISKIFVDDIMIMYVNVEHETTVNNNVFGASSDKVLANA